MTAYQVTITTDSSARQTTAEEVGAVRVAVSVMVSALAETLAAEGIVDDLFGGTQVVATVVQMPPLVCNDQIIAKVAGALG